MNKEESQKIWGFHENTSLEEDKEKFSLSMSNFFKISRSLERWHTLFYKFWELGKPIFSRNILTAEVHFDKEGHCVNFLFNPDFWLSLDDYTREFVISHEMLHVILNHGIRIQDCKYRSVANQALDVVVNHALLNKFKFQRNKLKSEFFEKACWVDTVFPNETVPDNECFEFYYNKLLKKIEENDGGDGEGDLQKSGSSGSSFDNHDGLADEKMQDVIKKLDETLSPEQKEDLEQLVDEHFEKSDSTMAGQQSGNFWKFIDIKNKIVKKKKWESVIKDWCRSKVAYNSRDVEQWARINRRFTCLNKDLIIPSEMEVEDYFLDKKKIRLAFFFDTSGSCVHLAERFFKAANTIPQGKNDPFEVDLYCFDTQVFDVNLKDKKVYGFGGTAFVPIEEKILEVSKKNNVDYWYDAVWVLTDGESWDTVSPKKPEKWFWFLVDGASISGLKSRSRIPLKSKVLYLKDFE